MKLLITGGAGFIGSHLVETFLGDGHDVLVLDDLSTGKRENLPDGVPLHVHDVRSAEAADLVRRERPDVLIHQAAQMDVRRSVADPAFDANVNVLGFLNLMEAARESGLCKVLFASTGGAIYGEPEGNGPQTEDHTLQPLSPYGITKLVTEKYLFFYHQTYGIPYVALRYANVYGPRQNPHGEAGVVAIFTEKLLAGEAPVIHGDGRQTRDYVFVRDVAAANRAALAYDGVGAFNVGTGVETDVNTLFGHLNRLTGAGVPERHGPGKTGEQRRSVLSYARTQAKLGWQPRTALADGLAETVAWFRDR
jgi:UDP-glucose 4-epimerase